MTHEETMHRADADEGTALDQPLLNLDQGHVALCGNQLPDEAAMCFDLAWMSVTAPRLSHCLAVFQRELSPADRTRCADLEPVRRRTATQTRITRSGNPVTKILRKSSCHRC